MTSELLEKALVLVKVGAPWVGPALACATFAEAMVVVGVFIPVTPFLVLAGAAMGLGALNPATLAWASAGAFLGNAVSYRLGRTARVGGLAARLPARARAAAEALFARHGAAAIIIARFLGPPATVAPFLAGWSGLPWGRFLIASLAASLAWPPAMMGAGALLARILSLSLGGR